MLIVLLLLAAPALSFAAPIYSYDFEDTRTAAEYEGLSFTSAEPEIVSPGAGGSEHCLRLQTPEPAKYCQRSINVPFTVEKNLVLFFDYRAVSDPEPDGNYVGILFFDANGKQFGRFDHRFSDQWRHAEVPFGSLVTPNEGVLEVGLELVRLNLYGRADEDGAMMTVWLDNISLEARTTEGVLSDTVQTSWANPPLMCWGATEGASRLEYSRSPDFPEDETRTAETKWGFFMPERPLDPGEWYWRVWSQTPLSEGWGTIDLPGDDRYELRIEGVGELPRVTRDGRPVALELVDGVASGVIWDQPGGHHMTISGADTIEAVSLTPQALTSVAAEMMPPDWTLPDAAIIHEAEDVAEEGEIRGEIMEKVAASDGLAHAVWDTPGQWARWRIEVPVAGEYHLLVRGASIYDQIFRELRLDGELLQVASFGPTGGWCRATNDWRWSRLMAPDGDPLTLSLSAGEHTLYMQQLRGSTNLDAFALVAAS